MTRSAVRRRWHRGIEVALLLGSVGFALILLEIGWRFVVFGAHALSFTEMDSVQPLGEAGLLRPSPDSAIVFELRPDADQYFKLVPFRTNSRGLRDRPYPFAKPEGTLRVAVIGDSFTMAPGVPIERAFHSLLEQRFAEDGSDRPVEFINFGVGGYSLRHYVAVLRHRAIRYDPDLILIAYCGDNDHRVEPADYASRRFVARARTHAYFRSYVWIYLKNLVRSRRAEPGISEEELRYLREMFGELAEAGRAAGVPVVVAYLSNRPDQPERVGEVVREQGLGWVNASKAFAGTDVEDYSIYYPIDTHPNEAAHAIFADAIYEFLRSGGLTDR